MKKQLLAAVCCAALLLQLSGCTSFKEFFYLGDPTAPVTESAPDGEDTASAPAPDSTDGNTSAPDTSAPSDTPDGTLPSETGPSAEPTETTTLPPETTTLPPETTTLPPESTTGDAPSPDEPTVIGTTSNGYAIIRENGLTYINGVLIVNKTYSIPADYGPGDLTPECKAAFAKLQAAAAEEGLSIYLLSGYRSYETQTSLYNRYCARDGQAAADTYSARPGHSEHQTGLAIDVNSLSHTFADTKEGKWLAANAHLYGFIIRYSKDKQSVTGYAYEPWHIRYIGPLAQAVYESGLCLEEYFGITSVYS